MNDEFPQTLVTQADAIGLRSGSEIPKAGIQSLPLVLLIPMGLAPHKRLAVVVEATCNLPQEQEGSVRHKAAGVPLGVLFVLAWTCLYLAGQTMLAQATCVLRARLYRRASRSDARSGGQDG